MYRSKVTSLSKQSTSAYFKKVAYVFSAQRKGIGHQLKDRGLYYITTIAPSVKEFNCLFLNLNEAILRLPFDMMTS